ncbi:MAG TPA: response regulator [Longimicrobiales bacterium]|nr:response regulator [Longimicrobiales bacterium]
MPRLLLVDDDTDLRQLLARALAQFGHDVVEAGNGHEAMAHLRGDPPDLVITDINMPEMDGIEIINEVQAVGPPIPIIAMSGGGRIPKELLLANAGVLGAVVTLQKPFKLAALLAAVEGLLPGGGNRRASLR